MFDTAVRNNPGRCRNWREFTVRKIHRNGVWPSLDLKIEIWPSGTKMLATPDIRYALV